MNSIAKPLAYFLILISAGFALITVYSVLFKTSTAIAPVAEASKVAAPIKPARSNERSCYDIGLSYGAAAARALKGNSSSNDVMIPERCRGDASTSAGIRTAMKYSQ